MVLKMISTEKYLDKMVSKTFNFELEVPNNFCSFHFRQTLQHMSWPPRDLAPSRPSTLSAPSSLPVALRLFTECTSALRSPSSLTPLLFATSWDRGEPVILWWQVPSTVPVSSGPTLYHVLSPSSHSACLFTTACLICSSSPVLPWCSRFHTEDSLASGTTVSDGVSPRINFASTITPVSLRRTRFGAILSPAQTEIACSIHALSVSLQHDLHDDFNISLFHLSLKSLI